MNLKNLDQLIYDWKTLVPASHVAMENWYTHTVLGDYGEENEVDLCSTLQEVEDAELEVGCGTSACLAGWIQVLYARTKEAKEEAASDFAADWLELDYIEADSLFQSAERYNRESLSHITHHDILEGLNKARRLEADRLMGVEEEQEEAH